MAKMFSSNQWCQVESVATRPTFAGWPSYTLTMPKRFCGEAPLARLKGGLGTVVPCAMTCGCGCTPPTRGYSSPATSPKAYLAFRSISSSSKHQPSCGWSGITSMGPSDGWHSTGCGRSVTRSGCNCCDTQGTQRIGCGTLSSWLLNGISALL